MKAFFSQSDSSEKSDIDLIEAFRKGDEISFQILVKRYLSSMYRFVYSTIHEPHAADEVTQEVFIKVWRNLEKFDKEKNFKVWLYTIAKNAILDFVKKRKVLNFSELDEERIHEVRDESPLPQELLHQADLGKTLESALKKLPSSYREIFRLYYKENFNFREIAETFQKSINTLKSRHRRGLRMLKEYLPNSDSL